MFQPSARAITISRWLSWLIAALLLSGWASPGLAQVYKWIDEQGRVHFGDKPLHQNVQQAEKIELKSSHQAWQPLNIEVLYQGSLQARRDSEYELDQERIQRQVNWVYRFYDEVLYFDFYKKVPVKIHVLKNEREYHQYVFSISGHKPTNSLGVYLPSSHEIAVFIHPKKWGGKENTYKTIKHEASHAILHSLAERMPHWLNEGMAEQMETLSFSGEKFIIDRHRKNHRSVLARKKQLAEAGRFIEMDSLRWRGELANGSPHQAMAGQLVFLSLSKSYGRSFITRLLQDYKRGVKLRSFYLLDQHYIGGTSAFSLHWQQWLSQGMTQPERIVLP